MVGCLSKLVPWKKYGRDIVEYYDHKTFCLKSFVTSLRIKIFVILKSGGSEMTESSPYSDPHYDVPTYKLTPWGLVKV